MRPPVGVGRAVTTCALKRASATCAAALYRRPATGERKQVTVLFTDVVGSMKLAAALDAERLREIMNELFNRAAAVVQRYQGTVGQFTGDGLMALFGAPWHWKTMRCGRASQRWRSNPPPRNLQPRCFAVTALPCSFASG